MSICPEHLVENYVDVVIAVGAVLAPERADIDFIHSLEELFSQGCMDVAAFWTQT